MKNSVSFLFYFSNYSPKPFNSRSEAGAQSPFLKSILKGTSLTVSRARPMPLVSPYSGFKKINNPAILPSVSEDAGMNETGWYQNYE